MANNGVMPKIQEKKGYETGQKVCIWHESVDADTGFVTVLKEVIVTITEIKTGVPGEFSGRPSSGQSLRGTGDDGRAYEKHWDYWPESQTDDFIDRWSLRDDGEGEKNQFWSPVEAVYAYNRLADHNRKHGMTHGVLIRVGRGGEPMLPKGDVVRCGNHDEYYYPNGRCFHCFLDKKRTTHAG
jgi:hypothetical protein